MFPENTCRICLQSEENLTSTLFKKECGTSVNDLLSYCVPEIDWRCEQLPSLICPHCTENLHTCTKFRKQCLESEKIRQNYIAEQFNGLEDEENERLTEKKYSENLHNEKKAVRSFRRTRSKEKDSYECGECQKKFSSNVSYKIHVGKAHKKRWKRGIVLRSSKRNKKSSVGKSEVPVNNECVKNCSFSEIGGDCKFEVKEEMIAANNDSDFLQCDADVNVKNDFNESINIKNLDENYIDDSDQDLDDTDNYDNQNDNKLELNLPNIDVPSINKKLFPGKRDKKCKICLKEFTKTTTLLNHFRSVHSFENCFKCRFCDQAFPNRERLVRHENHHTGDRRYVCSTCGKKFFTSSDLFHHNERHTGDRKYTCDICNVKSFTTRNNLRTHKKIVHTNPEDWKFLCTHCGRKCVTQGALNAHMKRHGDRKDFPCSLCQKGFCTKAELEKHLRAHSDQREFKCDACGQQYKLKEILERHLFRKHGIGDKVFPERVKKHSCPVCPLKFCSKLQLEKHLRSHNGERPFKCSYCDHSFICSSYLKGHVKNKHPGRLFKEQNDSNRGTEVFKDT